MVLRCGFQSSKGRWVTITMSSTIRCNNDFALKRFALDGLGLALFPHFFVERELESGKLVQAITDYPPPELSINSVYEARRRLLPKLQAFLGFLKEQFGTKA